ncbi:AarF/ABC1/UbiB kinase family protein [Acaryochloris sp. CCMEE 5410]|uniref:ABC1 kinase family protein n=1 Tax=Acaryochloris sp. CCMEE 5410 TaxID=310037 RepID=UPI0002483D55|nr:AarF/ABC1/UbiB kinase family protein [Acaryochloris sp. CCMEE 5410]KAI9134134.1 AarF/ABC1/UbiB kinase family protein [Acaryochloris sp. CCMEE 5410]
MTLAEPTSPQSPSLPAGPSTADFSGVAVATENPSNLTSAIEFEAYDPAKIQQKFQGQIFRVLQRWVTILWPFLLLFARRWWDKRTPTSPERQKRRAVQLRETLTALGPAFIKIGQALSTRPDILTGPYLEELSKLQDQLPAFSNEIAYRFIEEELGHPPQDLYAQLTPEPIAAASLGQVYKGQLHSGEWVAVKVQRPDLAEQVTLDIYILRGLAAWVQKNNKSIRSDLVGILDEFAGRLFEEVDYTQEGRNAERFAHLYEYLPEIYIPKIYWEYTNRRVLTMEWITGTKLNQPEKIQAQGIDARHLIDVGVNCSLRQLLEHGFFHADPHPGNLLATPDGKLAYLDFGMMSEIKLEQRYGLINAIVHIINREFEALAHDYVHLGFLTPDTNLEPIIPALGIVFNNALGASVAELNIQSIFDQLSEIMYEYPFRVPSYYALIVRSLLTMEGIAIGVDKDFKVLSAAYPYVAKRILTDPAPELRESLKDLLFKESSFRWNRLENLMKNARNNFDYDLSGSLDQALDYLFSERGELIRDRMAQELVNGIDAFGQTTWHGLTAKFREQMGWETDKASVAELEANFGHIQRIFGLLQETPGFDPVKLASVVPPLLVKPETQALGQQIATGLLQKALVRVIREFLLPESSDAADSTRYAPPVTLSPLAKAS